MELVCKSRTERRPRFTRKHPRLARAGSNGWSRCSTDLRLSQSQPNSSDDLKSLKRDGVYLLWCLTHVGLETFAPETNPDFARGNFLAGWRALTDLLKDVLDFLASSA
jgi:hypothetical protein